MRLFTSLMRRARGVREPSPEPQLQEWSFPEGHACTDLADFFGGYLCECGRSWNYLHMDMVKRGEELDPLDWENSE